MRPDRRRKKKLTVAFHFQFSNQAAWKCDTCRKQGLEKKRRCSWIGPPDPNRVVWARADVRLGTCPKSYITAQSIDWLERYHVQRTFGFGDVMQLPARDVEAYCLIENEMNAERRRAQQ